jgi:predicted nucleic acid-binding protein
MLAAIAGTPGDTEVSLSVVTLIELAHGAARADTAERKAKRQQFIQELFTALPLYPVTASVALRAGRSMARVKLKVGAFRLPIC